MKIEYKIFLVLFMSILSVPLIFFTYLLLRLEYDEYLIFGNKEKAKVINVRSELGASSGEYGDNFIIEIKIISDKKSAKKNYHIYLLVDTNSITQNKKEAEFATSVKIGDSVIVRTISNHQAKILSWKGKNINANINYWGKTGRWLLILILISLIYFLFYKMFKIITK